MRFSLADGGHFEIPDEWWLEAGMDTFSFRSIAYRSKPLARDSNAAISIVPVSAIKPIHRATGVVLDFGGFERDRMLRVLRWVVEDAPMEPIQVKSRPDGTFLYEVYDGFHRFHASIAAGFTDIPVVIGNWGF